MTHYEFVCLWIWEYNITGLYYKGGRDASIFSDESGETVSCNPYDCDCNGGLYLPGQQPKSILVVDLKKLGCDPGFFALKFKPLQLACVDPKATQGPRTNAVSAEEDSLEYTEAAKNN